MADNPERPNDELLRIVQEGGYKLTDVPIAAAWQPGARNIHFEPERAFPTGDVILSMLNYFHPGVDWRVDSSGLPQKWFLPKPEITFDTIFSKQVDYAYKRLRKEYAPEGYVDRTNLSSLSEYRTELDTRLDREEHAIKPILERARLILAAWFIESLVYLDEKDPNRSNGFENRPDGSLSLPHSQGIPDDYGVVKLWAGIAGGLPRERLSLAPILKESPDPFSDAQRRALHHLIAERDQVILNSALPLSAERKACERVLVPRFAREKSGSMEEPREPPNLFWERLALAYSVMKGEMSLEKINSYPQLLTCMDDAVRRRQNRGDLERIIEIDSSALRKCLQKGICAVMGWKQLPSTLKGDFAKQWPQLREIHLNRPTQAEEKG